MKKNFHKDFPNQFKLPKRINRLGEFAYNLWWAWNPNGMRLFLQLDRRLWETVSHNPIAFLHQIEPQRLKDAEKDIYYLEEYDRVMAEFDAYMSGAGAWFEENHPELKNSQMAYFSFEFGCMNPCRFMLEGWGSFLGITSRKQVIWACPLLALALSTSRDILSKISPKTDGRKQVIIILISRKCPSSQ